MMYSFLIGEACELLCDLFRLSAELLLCCCLPLISGPEVFVVRPCCWARYAT